jgi:histone deacetylase HOS3
MLISAGSAVKAMEAVLNATTDNNKGTPAPNSFAAIRPPGHHASMDTPCGFCLVNNVAICAKKVHKRGIITIIIMVLI